MGVESADTVLYRANVVSSLDGTTKLRWPHNFGAYRLTDHDLACGSLLGSPKLQLSLKATGAIERIYCVDAGAPLIGAFLVKHWDERAGMKLDPETGHFFLYAEHQEHRYMLSNGVYVFEDVFVHCSGDAAYYVVELTNDSEEEQRIATYAFCELAKDTLDQVQVRYDDDLRAFIASSCDNRNQVRIFGASRKPVSYEVSIDHAKAVTGTDPGRLSNKTEAPAGLPCGIMHFSTVLGKGEKAKLVFTFALSARGEKAALDTYRNAPKAESALEQTQRSYHDTLEHAVAITPNAEINRGVLWAKTNMLRVMLKPPSGWTFTNDPMESTKAVGRDAAWFCAGADYFRPDFSAECLMQFITRQERSGMFIEFYDMLSDKRDDFGLNVNDDTPLIVWSAWHHYQMTGDRAFLEQAYPAAVKAGHYLAKQRNDRGLVWCSSRETGSRGIAGWRNVIQNYRLSGATTEINSLCFAAFRSIAHMARTLGEEETSASFETLALELKDAINEHLFNPGNGLYYLNIDVDGTPRSDVTADLVFPVMFGVADRTAATHVIRRLSDRDFWTPGGMRTIPHDAINYTPESASGCLGGVWNGVTFWYAKAAAEYMPDFSEEALTNGFENYARDPQRNNTVPGEFSEWLHGETLVNQGMPLSPWFPPRYIWAVIEGIFGLDISGDKPALHPNLPSRWNWCGLRNVPFRGKRVTWFFAKMPELRMWCNEPIECSAQSEILPEDVSERFLASGDDAITAALSDNNRIVGIVGNIQDRTITTAVRLRDAGAPHVMRVYDSMKRGWLEPRTLSADELAGGVTTILEPNGFHVIELRRENR
jgi:mannosylglycerate hydrolase MGH1-like protein